MPTMKPRRRISRDRRRAARRARRAASASSAIFGCSALERALVLEDVERRERGRAGERVARVRVAVEERPELLERAEEALVDALGRERRGERQVAAGQALGEAEEVGRDVLLLAGEHRARCGRSRSRPRRRSGRRRGGRTARAPRAGSRRGARGCPPRPARAARRSPRRPRRRARPAALHRRRCRRARPGRSRRAAAGSCAVEEVDAADARPSRSCRRGSACCRQTNCERHHSPRCAHHW